MSLKDLYENWPFKTGNQLGNKTPRDQAEGKIAVNFLQDNYQGGIKNRTPGDKVVTQATTDDATVGNFSSAAFSNYSRLFMSPIRTFKSKVVHLYNAQGTDAAKYVTSDKIKKTPGALYNTNR